MRGSSRRRARAVFRCDGTDGRERIDREMTSTSRHQVVLGVVEADRARGHGMELFAPTALGARGGVDPGYARHSLLRSARSPTFGAKFRLFAAYVWLYSGCARTVCERATPGRRRALRAFCVIAKLPQLVGWSASRKRLGGGPPEIIEYKTYLARGAAHRA